MLKNPVVGGVLNKNRMLFKLSAGGSAFKKHADYGRQRNESHVGVEEKGQSDQLIG